MNFSCLVFFSTSFLFGNDGDKDMTGLLRHRLKKEQTLASYAMHHDPTVICGHWCAACCAWKFVTEAARGNVDYA